MTRRKLAASPAMPALSRMAPKRLELLVGAEHRAAHQPAQIGAFADQRVELVEIGLDRIDGLVLERQLEQGAGVTAGHAGNKGVFACHGDARFCSNSSRPRTVADGRRNLLEFKEEFRSARTRGMPAETPREIEAVANTAAIAVQQCTPVHEAPPLPATASFPVAAELHGSNSSRRVAPQDSVAIRDRFAGARFSPPRAARSIHAAYARHRRGQRHRPDARGAARFRLGAQLDRRQHRAARCAAVDAALSRRRRSAPRPCSWPRPCPATACACRAASACM